MYYKNKEYYPVIEKTSNTYALYICFKDSKIKVSKEIFLQFFGLHKQISCNGRKHYFIIYHNNLKI